MRPSSRRFILEVKPYSTPAPRIVKFKNGRANLRAIFRTLTAGQAVSIRMGSKGDMTRIVGAANNAKLRIKINRHPAMNTVTIVSLGPQRKRGGRHLSPEAKIQPRRPHFKGWADLKLKPPPKPEPDIFS